MPLPEHLLEQAQHLARREKKRPRQASLRRAVSTAYYALFHLLIEEATKNWKRAAQRALLARAFEHGRMKGACDKKRSELSALIGKIPPPPAQELEHLYTIVETFIQAQQQRHTADYDNSRQWTRTEVLAQIGAVHAAFQSWKAIRKDDLAQDFLVHLLVRER
jgi:uncharacterized protein (UPF0332 family)